MAQNKTTGGPAFPDPGRAQSGKVRERLTDTGMTLRDHFAGLAMQAHLSSLPVEFVSKRMGSFEHGAAAFAYCMADAMLKARES